MTSEEVEEATLDAAGAFAHVKRFVQLLETLKRLSDKLRFAILVDPTYKALESQVDYQLPLIKKIASVYAPDQVAEIGSSAFASWVLNLQRLDAGRKLLAIIDAEIAFAALLNPSGHPGSHLHPVVSKVVSVVWGDGRRRATVQEAAVAILEKQLPAKLGVPKTSPAASPGNAFSDRPPSATSPRLRLRGFAEETDDWRSAHEGARFLGMACEKLVRNLTSHDATDLEEGVALEELAMLSRFARLVDSAEVAIIPAVSPTEPPLPPQPSPA